MVVEDFFELIPCRFCGLGMAFVFGVFITV